MEYLRELKGYMDKREDIWGGPASGLISYKEITTVTFY